jgi:hypothetical protein
VLLKNEPNKDQYQAYNFSGLATLSVEQYIFSKARLKNNINVKFEKIIKECAIDVEHNREGNIVGYEQMIYEKVNNYFYNRDYSNCIVQTKIGELFFYDRTKDSYYLSKGSDDRYLININMNFYYDDGRTFFNTWPSTGFSMIETSKGIEITTPDVIDEIKSNKNETLYSIRTRENISSFNANPKFNSLNFFKLKEIATRSKSEGGFGEETSAWEIIENSIYANRLTKFLYQNIIRTDDIFTMLYNTNIDYINLSEEELENYRVLIDTIDKSFVSDNEKNNLRLKLMKTNPKAKYLGINQIRQELRR